jgi:hypothetical protein
MRTGAMATIDVLQSGRSKSNVCLDSVTCPDSVTVRTDCNNTVSQRAIQIERSSPSRMRGMVQKFLSTVLRTRLSHARHRLADGERRTTPANDEYVAIPLEQMPIRLIIRGVKRIKRRLREEGDPEDVRLPYLIFRRLARLVSCCCVSVRGKNESDPSPHPATASPSSQAAP